MNFFIDPAHYFDTNAYYTRLASYLVSGKHLANIDNIDYRKLIKAYSQQATIHSSIIIGSSTALGIGTQILNDSSVFNYSVTSGTLEDYLGIYRLLEKQHKEPDRIILAMNPWVFSDQEINNDRLYPIRKEYEEMRSKLNALNNFNPPSIYSNLLQKFKILFSADYFKQSISALLTRQTTFGTTNATLPLSIKLNDGTINYYKYWARDTARVNKMAREYFHPNERYLQVSKTKATLFEKFINYLQSKNIKIVFYVSPYHPYTYEIKEVQLTGKAYYNYLHQLSELYNIPLIGSVDPNEFKLAPEDFFDGMHIKNSGIQKIFKKGKNNSSIGGSEK